MPVGITNYGPISNVTLYTNDVNSEHGPTAMEIAFRNAQNNSNNKLIDANGKDIINSFEGGANYGNGADLLYGGREWANSQRSSIQIGSMGESARSVEE